MLCATTSADRRTALLLPALCVLLIAEGHRPNQVADWLGEHTRTLELAQTFRRQRPQRPDGSERQDARPNCPNEECSATGRISKITTGLFQPRRQEMAGKLLRNHLSANYGVDFSLRQCRALDSSGNGRARSTTSPAPARSPHCDYRLHRNRLAHEKNRAVTGTVRRTIPEVPTRNLMATGCRARGTNPLTSQRSETED